MSINANTRQLAELANVFRVNAVRAQVQAVARKYLDPSRLQIVAVGDRAQIGPDLARFGALEAFDADGRPIAAGSAGPGNR